MQKDLKGFSSKEPVFIDANIFLHHAFDTNAVSIDFLKKVESSQLRAYTSALIMEEVTFKLVMQSASNLLAKITVQGLKTILKDMENRKKVMAPVEAYREYINRLLDMGLVVLDLKDEDMVVALHKARIFGLLTADAAHLAVMERKGIVNLASADGDFEVVDYITVWSP